MCRIMCFASGAKPAKGKGNEKPGTDMAGCNKARSDHQMSIHTIVSLLKWDFERLNGHVWIQYNVIQHQFEDTIHPSWLTKYYKGFYFSLVARQVKNALGWMCRADGKKKWCLTYSPASLKSIYLFIYLFVFSSSDSTSCILSIPSAFAVCVCCCCCVLWQTGPCIMQSISLTQLKTH